MSKSALGNVAAGRDDAVFAGLSSASLHEAADRIGALPSALHRISSAMVMRGGRFRS